MQSWTDGLPSALRVAAFDISIEVKDGNWAGGTGRWGEFSAIEQAIRVQGDMTDRFKFMDTLIHEINHAIWWAYGIEDEDKEERTVVALATGWTQVYRDNPELAKWICKQVKE